MTPDDPLSQLKDIHLPASGGFWPPAPGWWLLAAMTLALLAALVLWWRRRRRRNRWRRDAERLLAQLQDRAEASPAWFAELNALLKRVARTCHPEQHPESLSGEAWIDFLLATAPRDRIAARPVVAGLVRATWRPSTDTDPAQALNFARLWLGGQRC